MPNDRYEVLSQDPGFLRGPTGTAVSGFVVTFRSKANGQTGRVEIPDAQYTADNVHRAVLAAVDIIDAVHAL